MTIDVWFYLIGGALIIVGLILAFATKRAQMAMAFQAFGLTFAGLSAFLRSLRLVDVVIGTSALLLAAFIVFVAAALERKERAAKARIDVQP